MAWTSEQIAALYINVYRNEMTCPACAGRVALARSAQADAMGIVECADCHQRHLVAMRNDPLRSEFRDYTELEKKQIIAADKSRRTPVCPVDATPMEVNVQRSLGRTSNVIVRCRRCDHSVEYARAHG